MGILLFDLPVAFLVAFVFHTLVKYPLYKASPAWFQSKVNHILNYNWVWILQKRIWIVVISICIGVGTHLLFDGMTHHDGWMVVLFPAFTQKISFLNFTMPIYDMLQYSLSLLGLYCLFTFWQSLETRIVLVPKDDSTKQFWMLTLLGAVLAIACRIFFFPEFISFWDGFMMSVGAFLYGIVFASLIEFIQIKVSGSNSQRDEFINSRGADPRFKRRALFVKQDKSFGMFGKGVMHVDHFIDKTKVVFLQTSYIKVNQVEITSSNVTQSAPESFSSTSFGFTTDFHFKSGFVFSCNQKITECYFHFRKGFEKYINTAFKLIGFLAIILSPFAANAQDSALDPAKREQYIKQATQLRSEENYGGAIAQLDSILNHNEKDAQILLFKGDLCLQKQDFNQAVDVYSKLVPLDYERTIAQVNLSYALFMSKKPSKALSAAYDAWDQDRSSKNAVVNYFNALLWNIKTKDAEAFLEENLSIVDPDQVLVMKARLSTTAGNYSDGLAYYDTLVQKYPKAPYIQEFAEVMIGKKQWGNSQALVDEYDSTLSVSQKQRIEGLLNQGNTQSAGIEVGYFADVAQNTRTEQSIFWQNQFSAPVQVGVRVGANQVKDATNQVTKSTFVAASVSRVWSPAWQSRSEIMVQQISPEETDSFTGVTGKFETKYQPNDRRMFGLNYSSDILNFTADLLGKDIRSHNLGYVTHLMLDGKTGFYSQGSFGMLNDQNSRIQFFGSVYRLLRTEPTLKTGVNFSALSFTDSETTLYFAPEQFLSTEIFVDYSTPMPLISKLALKVQAAAGLQQIEHLGWDPSFRAEAEFNYRFKGYDLGLKGQFSNVAASSGTGYKFQYFTFRVSKSF